MPIRIGVLSLPENFHCLKWTRALQKAGAETVIFTLSDLKGEGIVNLTPPVVWGGRYRFPSYLLTAQTLKKALISHNIDVLYAMHLTPFGVWARLSGFRPTIVAAMGADVFEYTTPQNRRWRETALRPTLLDRLKENVSRPFYRKAVAETLRYADAITADNQPLIDEIVRFFGVSQKKTHLIRWGLDETVFETQAAASPAILKKFGAPPGSQIILSPRGAKPIYQTDIILRAIERFLDVSHQNIFFIVLSAGYEISPDIKKEALRLQKKYPNRFRFVENLLTAEETAALWQVTDAFISAPVYDGYSAAVSEGRFAGAVPIVNATPGALEIITDGQNGLVVEPFTAENLFQILLNVAPVLPELKQKFAPLNRKWIIQNGLLTQSAKDFLELAESILNKKFP